MADPHTYAFWAMDNLILKYRGDWLETFGYTHGMMHQLLYGHISPFHHWDDWFLTYFLQSLFDRGIFICITSHSFEDFFKMSLQKSTTLKFWPSHYLWLHNESFFWYGDGFPSGLFFFRLPSSLFFLDDDGFPSSVFLWGNDGFLSEVALMQHFKLPNRSYFKIWTLFSAYVWICS